ncbi:MAG: ATP synthase F1 subunit gamma [Rikenellaceae bacterium]|nr:ATP synthase F1 subunit gamma [Rikenellaceae bacterium]
MAALKEIKARIASVNNTLKITSAMKMVASAKLHRVQAAAEALSEYEKRLSGIASALCEPGSDEKRRVSPLALPHRKMQRVAVVAFASDSSLCGGFNNNAVRALSAAVEELRREGFARITLYPVGEKMVQAVTKAGYEANLAYRDLSGKPDYAQVARLADELMAAYLKEDIDRVCVVYNHFHSMGHQAPRQELYLPMSFGRSEERSEQAADDYICEPEAERLSEELLPYELRTKLYEILLDHSTSEHAARMVAMQTATDNAQELLEELSLTYNKRRQQAITDELADITQAD